MLRNIRRLQTRSLRDLLQDPRISRTPAVGRAPPAGSGRSPPGLQVPDAAALECLISIPKPLAAPRDFATSEHFQKLLPSLIRQPLAYRTGIRPSARRRC